MITYVKGNAITLAEKGNHVGFVHGCNCLNRMGRGIAKEVKDRLPEMYAADQKTRAGDRGKLGSFSLADYSWGRGYNLYTQFSHSDKDDMVDWIAVGKGLKRIFADMADRGLTTLVMPKICSGLARGHLTEEQAWAKVEAMLQDAPVEILVVEYDPHA